MSIDAERIARAAAARFARDHDPAISAQDRQQEARMAIARAEKKFDPERGVKFSTYAWCAARNAMHDMYVRKRPAIDRDSDHNLDAFVHPDHATSELEGLADREDATVKCQAIMSVLGEQESRMVRMWMGGMTHKQIAQQVGTTRQKVVDRLEACMEKMREHARAAGIEDA